MSTDVSKITMNTLFEIKWYNLSAFVEMFLDPVVFSRCQNPGVGNLLFV
jgi:hypothetical protein